LAGAAVVAGGGLVLSLLDEDAEDIPLGTQPGTLEPNAFLQVTPAGEIVLQVDKVEMGQGVMAGFVTMLAEELGATPDQITPRHPAASPGARVFSGPDPDNWRQQEYPLALGKNSTNRSDGA
jgi:hypothetical protein